MRLSVISFIRCAVLLSIASTIAFASAMYDFPGPVVPSAPFVGGAPCVPAAPCIAGDANLYGIFDLNLAQVGTSNTWTMTLTTNYPTESSTGLPTSSTPVSELSTGIPGEPYGGGPSSGTDAAGNTVNYAIGDLLFEVNTGSVQVPNYQFFALVLTPHDGLTTGEVYKASSSVNSATCEPSYVAGQCAFLTAQQVLQPNDTPRGDVPVWLAPGSNTDIGSSSALTMALTGTTATGLFTITDTFTIGAGSAATAFQSDLTSGDFLAEISSYVCGNGVIIGSGAASQVPEPRALFLLIPLFLLLGRRFARTRVQAS